MHQHLAQNFRRARQVASDWRSLEGILSRECSKGRYLLPIEANKDLPVLAQQLEPVMSSHAPISLSKDLGKHVQSIKASQMWIIVRPLVLWFELWKTILGALLVICAPMVSIIVIIITVRMTFTILLGQIARILVTDLVVVVIVIWIILSGRLIIIILTVD